METFFMISGFYMALVLNEKYLPGQNSYRLFLSNRLLRLFPIYWLLLLTTVGLSAVFLWRYNDPFAFAAYQDVNWQMSARTWFVLAVTNLFVVGQDLLDFAGFDRGTGQLYFTTHFLDSLPRVHRFLPVGQAWSLSIEICFYVIAPFLVRRKLPVLLALMAVSLAIRLSLASAGLYNDPFSYRFFPSELVFFLGGAVAYRNYLSYRSMDLPRGYLQAMLGGMVLFTLTYTYLPGGLAKQLLYYGCFFGTLPFVFLLTKRSRWDAKVGELSYPIYMVHFIILFLVPRLLSKAHLPVESWEIPAEVVSVLLAAAFLVKAVVEPIERIRQRRVKKPQRQPAVR